MIKKIKQVIKVSFYLLIFLSLTWTCSAQSNNKSTSTEEQKKRLIYLQTAKEMALRSAEIKDSTFQALVAVQAHNFNKNHQENTNDSDIYRALYNALERFNDPMLKELEMNSDKENNLSAKAEAIASKLCSHVKRNLTIEEWDRFASQLPYESTCSPKKYGAYSPTIKTKAVFYIC